MHIEPDLLNDDSQAPVARCRPRCWFGASYRRVALFANIDVLSDALQALSEQQGCSDTANPFIKLASWKH